MKTVIAVLGNRHILTAGLFTRMCHRLRYVCIHHFRNVAINCHCNQYKYIVYVRTFSSVGNKKKDSQKLQNLIFVQIMLLIASQYTKKMWYFSGQYYTVLNQNTNLPLSKKKWPHSLLLNSYSLISTIADQNLDISRRNF